MFLLFFFQNEDWPIFYVYMCTKKKKCDIEDVQGAAGSCKKVSDWTATYTRQFSHCFLSYFRALYCCFCCCFVVFYKKDTIACNIMISIQCHACVSKCDKN